MEENIKYESIPYDALIDIQISGSFYKQLIDLLTALGNSIPLDEFKDILKKFKDDESPKNTFELNIYSLISLIYELETKAKEQKKIKEITINANTGQPVTES